MRWLGCLPDDVVKKFGLKTQTVPVIDAQGRGTDGKPIDPPQLTTLVCVAFATNAGDTTPLSELGMTAISSSTSIR